MSIRLNKELCYRIIVNKRNTPHTVAITLLEEVIDKSQLQVKTAVTASENKVLYSPLKEGWKVDYKYFKEKYNFGHAKVRYAFRILEKYKLITRKRIVKAYIPSVDKGGSETYVKLDLEKIKYFLEM